MSGSGGSSLGLSINVEFYLLDFSGIAMVSPKDQSGAGSGTSTVPNAGWSFTTNQTDLGITSYSGQPGANVSAGSCCTLGTNATLATVGQVQYALNLSAGTPSDAFSGATLPSWTSAWITFKGATGSSAVPRRRGYVF